MCVCLRVCEQGEMVNNGHQMLVLVIAVGVGLEVWSLCRREMISIAFLHPLWYYLICYSKHVFALSFQKHKEMEIFYKEKYELRSDLNKIHIRICRSPQSQIFLPAKNK